jgi:hypothetical protein
MPLFPQAAGRYYLKGVISTPEYVIVTVNRATRVLKADHRVLPSRGTASSVHHARSSRPLAFDESTRFQVGFDLNSAPLGVVRSIKRSTYGRQFASLLANGSPTQSQWYNLVSITCHTGASDRSGHFVAFVKRPLPVAAAASRRPGSQQPNHQWFFCDDATVDPGTTFDEFSTTPWVRSSVVEVSRFKLKLS